MEGLFALPNPAIYSNNGSLKDKNEHIWIAISQKKKKNKGQISHYRNIH